MSTLDPLIAMAEQLSRLRQKAAILLRLERLPQEDANVNVVDDNGRTALQVAEDDGYSGFMGLIAFTF